MDGIKCGSHLMPKKINSQASFCKHLRNLHFFAARHSTAPQKSNHFPYALRISEAIPPKVAILLPKWLPVQIGLEDRQGLGPDPGHREEIGGRIKKSAGFPPVDNFFRGLGADARQEFQVPCRGRIGGKALPQDYFLGSVELGGVQKGLQGVGAGLPNLAHPGEAANQEGHHYIKDVPDPRGIRHVPLSVSTQGKSSLYFFMSLYSRESTRARQEAWMIFSLTPTVPHFFFPSVDSIRTRTLDPVPLWLGSTRTL